MPVKDVAVGLLRYNTFRLGGNSILSLICTLSSINPLGNTTSVVDVIWFQYKSSFFKLDGNSTSSNEVILFELNPSRIKLGGNRTPFNDDILLLTKSNSNNSGGNSTPTKDVI